MFYYDTETLGLTGPPILIQYAIDDGPVRLHDPWREPVDSTIQLLGMMCDHEVCAWNNTFDWFKVNWLYNVFICLDSRFGGQPPNVMEAWHAEKAIFSPEEAHDWMFLNPKGCLDLYIQAIDSKYAYLRRNKSVYIPKVPLIMAERIVQEINKAKVPTGTRLVYTLSHKMSPEETGLVDIEIKINPRNKDAKRFGANLKFVHLLETKGEGWPDHVDTLESALDVYDSSSWGAYGRAFRPYGGNWFSEVPYAHTPRQLEYARHDITMLRDVHGRFQEQGMAVSDRVRRDSRLTCAVACTRLMGFEVDHDLMHKKYPHPTGCPTYWQDVKPYILEVCPPAFLPLLLKDDMEIDEDLEGEEREKAMKAIVTTRGAKLDWLAEHMPDTPLGQRAAEVKKERSNEKIRKLYEYLYESGRFYPDARVSGTFSNRSSGGSDEGSFVGNKKGGSINSQGWPKTEKDIILGTTHPQWTFGDGDFDGFEVTISVAVWGSELLTAELKAGKSIHGLFGAMMYDVPYEEIMLGRGIKDSMYSRAKNGVFSSNYGGGLPKLATLLNLDKNIVEPRYERWKAKYNLEDDVSMFDLLRDWEWHEPQKYCTTILGFKRPFDIEIAIARRAYEMLQESSILTQGVAEGREYRRKDKVQNCEEACRSAFWSVIMRVQGRIKRMAKNHRIQSMGGDLCKEVQKALWDLQPVGIHPAQIITVNVHDALPSVYRRALKATVRRTIRDSIERLRPIVPLLAMTWEEDIPNMKGK